MWVLVRVADRTGRSEIWGWLVIGLLVWAPQDMLISLQAAQWQHVRIDSFALASLLPPLLWLFRHDRLGADAKAIPTRT
jgi:hypothetical protein